MFLGTFKIGGEPNKCYVCGSLNLSVPAPDNDTLITPSSSRGTNTETPQARFLCNDCAPHYYEAHHFLEKIGEHYSTIIQYNPTGYTRDNEKHQ